MRRRLILALVIALAFGPLAACGKKAAPRLPEGEELKVSPGKKGKQQIGVTQPREPGEEGTQPPPEETPDQDNSPAPDLAPERGF